MLSKAISVSNTSKTYSFVLAIRFREILNYMHLFKHYDSLGTIQIDSRDVRFIDISIYLPMVGICSPIGYYKLRSN